MQTGSCQGFSAAGASLHENKGLGPAALLAGTGRGKGIKSNIEQTEELPRWEVEVLGSKHCFWGGSASRWVILRKALESLRMY